MVGVGRDPWRSSPTFSHLRIFSLCCICSCTLLYLHSAQGKDTAQFCMTGGMFPLPLGLYCLRHQKVPLLWKTGCRCFSVLFKSLLSAVAAVGKWKGWKVGMVLNFSSWRSDAAEPETPAVHLFSFSFPIFISHWWHYWPLLRAATLDSWLTL